MAQHHNPKIVTDGLVFNLDTLGGRGPNKIITKPTQIDGCTLWLDADDEESVVSTTNWLDKSGQGHHLASTLLESSGASAPVLTKNVINGRSAMKFDGTDDYMRIVDTLDVSATTGFTQFFVFNNVSAPSTCVVGGLAQSGASSNFVQLAEDKFGFGGGGTATVVSTAVRPNTPFIVMGRRVSGSGTVAVDAKWNGVSYAGTTSAYGTVDRFHIGGNSYDSGSQYYNGYICEVIVYNTNLSDTQVEQVELYLSRKWNIPLPTSHREQTSPNSLQSGSIPVSGHKNGELFQVGDSMYFKGGPNSIATGSKVDYINCGNVLGKGSTYSSGSPFSYEVWAKDHGSETSWKTLIGSSSYAQIHFKGNDGIHFQKNGGGDGGSEKLQYSSKQLHEWYHIVGTFEGGTSNTYSGDISTGPYLRKLYVNGEYVARDRQTFYGGNIGDSYIGSYHANGLERFPGELAVARIYNKELTHAEVKQNYNAQSARIAAIPKIAKPGNLVLYLDAGIFESYRGTGSGTTVYDLSGEGNDGSLTNGTAYDSTLPENDMGKSFVFDGTNDYIEVADSSELDITGDITLAAWVNGQAAGNNGDSAMIINKRDANDYTTPFTLYFRDAGGEDSYRFYVGGGGSTWSDNAGDDDNFDGVYDKWDYVVATIEGTSMKMYVNGVLSGTQTVNGSRQTNNSPVKIGGPYTNGGTNYMWDGKISVVMIYNTALSNDEIVQNYNYHRHRYGR